MKSLTSRRGQFRDYRLPNHFVPELKARFRVLYGSRNHPRALGLFDMFKKLVGLDCRRRFKQVKRKGCSDQRGGAEDSLGWLAEAPQAASNYEAQALRHIDLIDLEIVA